MKKTQILLLLALIPLMQIFSSCEKDDNPITKTKKTITIDASDYSSWVYFSFEKDTIVQIRDFSTSTDWDIAFHRYNLRINCGTSGPGEGGSYATGETNFDNVTTAPDEGYSLNDSIDIAVDITSFPPVMETVPGDTVLANWINMTYVDNAPVYTYSNEVFVIKTADGKKAKIKFTDYFSDDAKSGHVTMEYLYQPDGSDNLQ